jgi:hypothetical protein
VSIANRLRRWRALHGIPALAADSREGSRVCATGTAVTLDGDDPFVPPIAGVPCVVAWSKFHMPDATRKGRNAFVTFERWHLRPFALELGEQNVLVDGSHVDLVFPIRIEGRAHEISIAVGQRVTIVGTVLRDGIVRPDDTLAFRDARVTCKLVGNKEHPIVIVDAV